MKYNKEELKKDINWAKTDGLTCPNIKLASEKYATIDEFLKDYWKPMEKRD